MNEAFLKLILAGVVMDITKVIELAKKSRCEYCDVRHSETISTRIETKNREVEKITSGASAGFGVKILFNGNFGFSYTNKEEELKKCFEKAFGMVKNREKGKGGIWQGKAINKKIKTKFKISPLDVPIEEKLKNILEISSLALIDKKIIFSNAVYLDRMSKYVIATSEGSLIEIEQPKTVVRIMTTAKKNNTIESNYDTVDGQVGFELVKNIDKEKFSRNVSEITIKLLTAKKAPGGYMSVIINQKLAGVFAHEAVGHTCEADNMISNSSVYKDKIGEKIASDLVTLIDEPKEGTHGYYPFDSEGTPAGKTILIKNGILQNYLHSRETAFKLGAKPTGNGRAMSVFSIPIPRMSCTRIANGNWNFDEMIESIKKGVYLIDSQGGQTNPALGTFQFGAKYGYLIENGKLMQMIKNVGLNGSILTILNQIDAVGNDIMLSGGSCGKNAQLVEVSDGSPHIRIKNILVGGEQ